ncbi:MULTISPECIES: phosphotransferase family protein [Saccharibacillus]|uniref:phosphotransferase family protein n=1 Tax=Saccharibacillus TaxID=456492 RepID=UPI00123AAD17|nr:aminoglycoside phosphotransferase family protein [Saccharibacillus sp. WB 17]MWJ30398.1 phosphotransferase [Saccharibacillus sp. WB 17]
MTHPFARRIQDCYPEMPIVDVQTEHAAQRHIVFTVNYRLIFRFATTPKTAEALWWETEVLLPAVARAASLPVPRPERCSFERLEPGAAFMGYARIDGEPLWPETLGSLEEPDVIERAAEVIAAFLYALHTLDLPAGHERRLVAGEDEAAEQEDLRTLPPDKLHGRILGELFERLSPQSRQRFEQDYAAFCSGYAGKTTDRSWIHGAFGPAHLLWDAQEEEVAGVVGFGSARIGDPALDLADVLFAYGPSFFARCVNRYPGGAALAGRAVFHAGLMPLREALHGLDTDDAESLQYGLEAYERETAAASGA